jgi:hypothetical protein
MQAVSPATTARAQAAAPLPHSAQHQPTHPAQSQQQRCTAAGCVPCHRAHPCLPPLSSVSLPVPSPDGFPSSEQLDGTGGGNFAASGGCHTLDATHPLPLDPRMGPHRQTNITSWQHAVCDTRQGMHLVSSQACGAAEGNTTCQMQLLHCCNSCHTNLHTARDIEFLTAHACSTLLA